VVIACITVVPEHVVCEIATPVTDTDTQTDRYTDRPTGKQTGKQTDTCRHRRTHAVSLDALTSDCKTLG